jgi:cytochrome c-type biogenesis protein CcmF
VLYVAENSNSHLSLFYRITALWGGHEGSILLWVTVLAIWTVLVATFSKSLPAITSARVLSILGFISIGFLLFLLLTSNPFARLLPNVPIEGRDLNPLLQDPGLAVHPPMLYMGYVGFSVAFAFAIAALLSGHIDRSWVRWVRPWTLAAWCFLTAGITLGSWWAYRVLGWGGWWFWDPVENASFLPWLTGTALIHSLAVTEKRGEFKSWSMLLAIAAFSLSLIGTFLVRSGILVSVHAFAVDPTRGAFILKFLFIVIGCSLLLFAWRANALKSSANFNLLSRETMLLTNNVLLITCMATVLLGTLYPLLLDVLQWGKISVGPPYFNTVFVPLFAILMVFMGIGPLCQWQQMSAKDLLAKIRWLLLASILLGLILPFIFADKITVSVVLGLSLAFWLIFSIAQSWYQRLKQISISKIPLSQYGMMIAHLGVAVSVIGITLTTHYSIERDVQMQIGDTVKVGHYAFKFAALAPKDGANYQALAATITISKNNNYITSVYPERRFFPATEQSTSIAAIDASIFRDLYVVMGENNNQKTWSVRIYQKPFIRWLWSGGLLMLLGGALALLDRRYRNHTNA